MENNQKYQTSFWERMTYGTYFFGQNVLYTIVASFISLFMMSKGVDEEAIALTLLIPKIFDAINDPFFGILMDKIKFKKGRFIPWLKISWVIIPLSTLFLFLMPKGLNEFGMCVWAIIGYVIWDIGYTLCDAPIFALSTSMSENQNERTSILAVGRFFATIGAMVATLVIQSTYILLGWELMAIIIVSLSALLMLPVLFLAKERSHAEIEKPVSVKLMFKTLFENKMLLVFFIGYLLYGITNVAQYMISIFAEYVLGDTFVGTILIGLCIIPAIIISVLLPKITQKVDKFYLYLASMIIFAISSILQYFVGYSNMILVYITTFLRGVGFSGVFVLVYFFTPDCVEYGNYKSGVRNEGVCFSLQTFITKVINALANSLCLLVLAWLGFEKPAEESAIKIVDSIGANACWTVLTVFCAIGAILAVPLLLKFYTLRDKDVQIMSKYNNGEITKEECDSLLSKKY